MKPNIEALIKIAKQSKSYMHFVQTIENKTPPKLRTGEFYRTLNTIWDIAMDAPWGKPMKPSDW